MKSQFDNVAGATGGVVAAIISTITSNQMIEVLFFGFVGGFIGIIGKKLGEWVWHKISNKFKKRK